MMNMKHLLALIVGAALTLGACTLPTDNDKPVVIPPPDPDPLPITDPPVPTGSGKALYVGPTGGSDTWTREQNDINHPWATPHKAWAMAQAGDVVYYRGGTYTLARRVCTRELGAQNGTIENPIVHTNYPGEVCTLANSTLKCTGSCKK